MASIRVWAFLSFAAATSSIARVIFRVFRIERIRRLISWTVATNPRYAAVPTGTSSLTWKRCLKRSISFVKRSASSSGRSPVSLISL